MKENSQKTVHEYVLYEVQKHIKLGMLIEVRVVVDLE